MGTYKGYTPAMARAREKYRATRARIDIVTTEDIRDAIQTAAKTAGQSVNAYVVQAVQERIERDKKDPD